jgi:hypothetical protein
MLGGIFNFKGKSPANAPSYGSYTGGGSYIPSPVMVLPTEFMRHQTNRQTEEAQLREEISRLETEVATLRTQLASKTHIRKNTTATTATGGRG